MLLPMRLPWKKDKPVQPTTETKTLSPQQVAASLGEANTLCETLETGIDQSILGNEEKHFAKQEVKERYRAYLQGVIHAAFPDLR